MRLNAFLSSETKESLQLILNVIFDASSVLKNVLTAEIMTRKEWNSLSYMGLNWTPDISFSTNSKLSFLLFLRVDGDGWINKIWGLDCLWLAEQRVPEGPCRYVPKRLGFRVFTVTLGLWIQGIMFVMNSGVLLTLPSFTQLNSAKPMEWHFFLTFIFSN